MVVEDGLTLTVIVGAVPLKTVPSDKVPEIVPVPVAVIVKFLLLPLQIMPEPLNDPVGLALILMVALPVLSLLIEVQPLLAKVAIV